MSSPNGPIFLIGFMGAGKSACADELARGLGRVAMDTDAIIEARDGRPIERIILEDGEPAFRSLERQVVRQVIDADAVVATGGGTFLSASNRVELKRHGLTVWLDVTLAEARRRVGACGGRPLWPDDPLELRALFERRRAAYALCARRVAAEPGDPAEVALRISRVIA